MVWVGISSALVWIMIPGIGLLYSGLSRKKHALSLLWASIMAACLTALQWFFWGYSLVFTHTSGSPFSGSLLNFCLMKVLGAPSIVSTVPDILFVLFQGIFAAVTAILMVGAGCERARLGPMMLFLFVWLTVVYIPVAYWIWGKNGCLVTLGCLDFAGGEPVHENFGFAALAYSLLLGKRHDPLITKKVPKFKPHSVTSIGFLQFSCGLDGLVSAVVPLEMLLSDPGTSVSTPIWQLRLAVWPGCSLTGSELVASGQLLVCVLVLLLVWSESHLLHVKCQCTPPSSSVLCQLSYVTLLFTWRTFLWSTTVWTSSLFMVSVDLLARS